MGYLGFKEDPAYILPKISSERVSWLHDKSEFDDGERHSGGKGRVKGDRQYVCRDLVEKPITHIW